MKHPPKNEIPKSTSTPRKRKLRKTVTDELTEEIVRLHEMKFSVRKMAEKTGLGRKVVRRVLSEKGLIKNPPPQPSLPKGASKLDPFKERIREKMDKNLTVSRILREITEQGYTGGRSILAKHIRENTVAPPPKKRVWRRFETAPGEDYEPTDVMRSRV